MQLGVMPIVSTVGGLPNSSRQAAPRSVSTTSLELASALTSWPIHALPRAAEPPQRRHYANRFAVDRAADGLLHVITEVLADRSLGRSAAAPIAPTSRRAP